MRPLTIKRLLWTCGGLAVLLLASVVRALKLGAVPVSVTDLVLDLGRIAIGRADELPTEYRLIVFDLRLPRILLGILVGAALSVAGASFQALLRNPLAGIILASFFSAIILFLMTTLTGRDLRGMAYWLMGDLSTPVSAGMQWIFIVGLVAGIGAIYSTSADLNLLLTGEREATHLGVNVTRVKLVVYVSASLLTALAVSVSGAIGYVG